METDMIIGIITLSVALAAVIALTLWARAIIRRMAKENFRSARQALKEMGIG